jgi:hypothetical protein
MADVILDYAVAEQARAAALGECVEPTVFRSETTGYARWSTYAQTTGRGPAWRAWSEDESCPQRNVAEDTLAGVDDGRYCAR